MTDEKWAKILPLALVHWACQAELVEFNRLVPPGDLGTLSKENAMEALRLEAEAQEAEINYRNAIYQSLPSSVVR